MQSSCYLLTWGLFKEIYRVNSIPHFTMVFTRKYVGYLYKQIQIWRLTAIMDDVNTCQLNNSCLFIWLYCGLGKVSSSLISYSKYKWKYVSSEGWQVALLGLSQGFRIISQSKCHEPYKDSNPKVFQVHKCFSENYHERAPFKLMR